MSVICICVFLLTLAFLESCYSFMKGGVLYFFFIGDCANNSDASFPDGAIDSDYGVYFISFDFHLNGELILFLRNFILIFCLHLFYSISSTHLLYDINISGIILELGLFFPTSCLFPLNCRNPIF